MRMVLRTKSNKYILFLSIIGLFFTHHRLTLAATTITSTIQPSSSDAELDQASPTTNAGSSIQMRTYPWSPSWTRRSIVKFDLSSIPTGSQVSAATLTLAETGTFGSTRTIGVHRVTTNWTESAVTWNSPWTTAGGDFVSTPTATASVSWTGLLDSDSWDVTTDVSAFVGGTATNYGWIVKDETENSSQQWWGFGTKENTTTSNRPKLTVVYIPPKDKFFLLF